MAERDREEVFPHGPSQRGCGSRVEGGLYACVETSPFGMDLSHFLIDPPIPWKGPRLRAPMLVEDSAGVVHVLLGIGATFYPSFVDFYEEARVWGVSKRLPRDFDPSRLTPGKSKLVLVHPKAIPLFSFEAEYSCPKRMCGCGYCRRKVHADGEPGCVGALWPLSALEPDSDKHRVVGKEGDRAVIATPSVTYTVKPPTRVYGEIKYQPGLVLQFGAWHVEYVSKSRKVPKEIKDRWTKIGFRLEVEVE